MIAYCLMPTHYHLLVSRAMQRLLISYTKAINNRFRRTGALFEGQFRAKPVADYTHLLRLCLYIHANPVKAGLVPDPTGWPYSNYREWIGESAPPFVQEHFGSLGKYQALMKDFGSPEDSSV